MEMVNRSALLLKLLTSYTYGSIGLRLLQHSPKALAPNVTGITVTRGFAMPPLPYMHYFDWDIPKKLAISSTG